MDAGIFAANRLKAAGARVVAVGVGAGLGPLGASNLRAVSGVTENSDYFRTTDYPASANVLAALAKANCQASVEVQKMIVPQGGTIANATAAQAGWDFAASTTTPGVTISGAPSATTTATSAGKVTFGVAYADPVTAGAVQVLETQKSGYAVLPVGTGAAARNAVCTNAATGAAVAVTDVGTAQQPGFTVPTQSGQQVVCIIYNQVVPVTPTPAEITVTKRVLDAAGIPQPRSGWTVGATADGTGVTMPAAGNQMTAANGMATWQASFATLASRASVSITEVQQDGYFLSSAECVVTPVTGSQRTIAFTAGGIAALPGTVPGVASGDKVVCTIVNALIPIAPTTVTVEKVLVAADGTEAPGAGWTLGAAVTSTPAAGVVTTPAAATQTADADGLATWTLAYSSSSARAAVVVSERQQVGWIVDPSQTQCVVKDAGTARIANGTFRAAADGTITLTDVGPGKQIICTIVNARIPPVSLPLTGGASADSFFIAGGVLLVMTIAGAGLAWRRRRVMA